MSIELEMHLVPHVGLHQSNHHKNLKIGRENIFDHNFVKTMLMGVADGTILMNQS